MKISVIVPVYKVEKYLDQCVKSIINQSYKNLEILLVNDGSPDRCGEICDDYAKIDPRVKVIHKKNGGLSSARNMGLDNATGDFIGFVDSDDWINQNFYELLINTAKKTKSDIVECNFIHVYDRESKSDRKDTREINTYNNIHSLECHFNSKHFYRCVWNKIYKKHLFDQIRFPVNKLAEDLFVTHELLYLAKKVAHIDYTGYYYFIRPDSIMGKNNRKLTLDTLEGMMEQHKFICGNAPQLKRYVDKLYMNCLLKSSAFIEKERKSEIKEKYKKLIDSELKRKDINVSGATNLALLFYKVSPKFFSNTLELIQIRNR